MFFGENACGQRFLCILIEDRDDPLRYYGAAVESLVNKMNGAAAPFDAVFKAMPLRVQPGEARQQARMNIQDAMAKGFNKVRREQSHVASQANEIYLVRV